MALKKKSFSEFMSLSKLIEAMNNKGVTRLYVKKLSPNDNNKNQPYLGGSFEALNIIPSGDIKVVTGGKDSKRDRYMASVNFFWIDSTGLVSHAPGTQLIMYPKYPEVRISGFLQRCINAPSAIMTPRIEKRLMFLGIKANGTILGHATLPGNPMYDEIEKSTFEAVGVFLEIPLVVDQAKKNKKKLLADLKNIHLLGWIDSIRLNTYGVRIPCNAPQCGGYTMEALLGIRPNSTAGPDYLGWEIKQHGVKALTKTHSGSPVTLMTPEPTGGFYKTEGVHKFMHTYGYPDKNGKPDRINFGGTYRVGKRYATTGLTTTLNGFDSATNKLTDVDGGLEILDDTGVVVASWSFSSLLELWKRKHAKAVYIPSTVSKVPARQYLFGNLIEMGEGTDFTMFLTAMASGKVYLDPSTKIEGVSTANPKVKKRNQFRISIKNLSSLYKSFVEVDLLKT